MPSVKRWARLINGESKAPLSSEPDYADDSREESFQQIPDSPFAPSAGSEHVASSASERDSGKPTKPAGILQSLPLPKVKLPKLPSNQRIVTFTTEKDVFRVVVFKGRRVVAWGSADPSVELEAEIDHPDDQVEELEGETQAEVQEEIIRSPLQNLLTELNIGKRSQIAQLLDKVGIRRGRTVMDLSLYTTLVRHLQIPKVKGRYLEPVVISEVLETLPFSKDEVDIAWQLQRDSDDNSVFAVAMPKQRLDAQVSSAKEAGLSPEAAYSKSAALAAVAGLSNGMVIHLERSEAALVLVQDGAPKAVHEVEFDIEDSDVESQGSTLARAFGQVASYYQSSDPKQQDQELPVILTGRTRETNAITQPLLDNIKGRLVTLAPPVKYPQDFPVEEYAINLGLYLTDQQSAIEVSEGAAQTPSLNLLPTRHRPSPKPVFQSAVFVILLLLVVHPFNVVGRVESKVVEQQVAARELNQLKGQEREFNVVLANYQEHQVEMEDVAQQLSQLEAQIETLDGNLNTLLQRMQAITRTAQEQDIELAAVAPQGNEFNLVAAARSHADALKYVLTLRNHPLFENARIVQIDGIGGADPNNIDAVVNFQVKVTKSKPKVEEEEDTGEGLEKTEGN